MQGTGEEGNKQKPATYLYYHPRSAVQNQTHA